MKPILSGTVTIGHGTVKDNWVRPKVCGIYEDDWLARTAFRFYGPRGSVADGTYYPPSLQRRS